MTTTNASMPRGRSLLTDPRYNRGTAFTAAERSALGLEGLLPPAVSSLEDQAKRSSEQYLADDEGSTLREAALALGVSAADFDRIIDPETMVGDPRRDLAI